MIKIKQIFILSILTYFAQGISALGGQAFTFYLKNLGWSPSKMMYVGSLIGLAWLIKPLTGYFLIDKLFTKKFWIVSSIVGSLIICLLMIFRLPLWVVIVLMFILSCNDAQRDIATDGLSCEVSKEENNTHNIQSMQWISITLAGIIVGLLGGWVAQNYHYSIGYIMLIPFYSFMLWFAKGLKIGKSQPKKINIKDLFKHKKFLWCCLFVFLYGYAPSFGTPLYFIQVDKFKWSQQFIGILGSVSSVVAIVGALCYNKWGNKINFKKVLILSVLIGACCSLCYLYYTPITALAYLILFSFVGMIIHLISMTWMAKVSITGLECTSFACLCAISNLSGTASSVSGAYLLPKIGLNNLILISALTSFVCLFFVKKIFEE